VPRGLRSSLKIAVMVPPEMAEQRRTAALAPELIAQTCTLALVALVLAGTLMTGSSKQVLLSPFPAYLHLDKLGHIVGFAGIGFAFVRSRFSAVRPWHIVAFAFALGVLTEFCQSFIPGRTAKLADVLIDVAGACAGVYFGLNIRPASPR
jgi:RsiW-degrading membrane proteinase PrsW (M82 family)